jgi:hypothetical protein
MSGKRLNRQENESPDRSHEHFERLHPHPPKVEVVVNKLQISVKHNNFIVFNNVCYLLRPHFDRLQALFYILLYIIYLLYIEAKDIQNDLKSGINYYIQLSSSVSGNL